jgi:tRNA pseudouridine32 synthase/23S rRNA pseudouridine746 synthase
MFGILITADGSVLKAYSGQICGRSDWEGYVPAVFDYLQPDGFFKRHEAEIVALHEAGQPTRERSAALQRWLFSKFMLCSPQGERRSVRDVFADWAEANHSKQVVPPGGTGECCAPKLLHYANSHGMVPVALTEFWYGASPKGEIRHHGMTYQPCQGKCQPIMPFLLGDRQQEVLGSRPASKPVTHLEVLYEDEWLIAVDKPAGMLSVPGKRDSYCAEKILHSQLSPLTFHLSPLFLKMVHRLDMDTSGVILAAKTPEVYKAMQRLFSLHEEVHKEYIAVLSPHQTSAISHLPSSISHRPSDLSKGRISLPLSADFYNRPRQIVDYEGGKEAVTDFEFLSDRAVRLKPLTGRTHQLRVHCAHPDGLGMPILGDPLYGSEPADRMYLHAASLTFVHPVTGQEVTIESPLPPSFLRQRM